MLCRCTHIHTRHGKRRLSVMKIFLKWTSRSWFCLIEECFHNSRDACSLPACNVGRVTNLLQLNAQHHEHDTKTFPWEFYMCARFVISIYWPMCVFQQASITRNGALLYQKKQKYQKEGTRGGTRYRESTKKKEEKCLHERLGGRWGPHVGANGRPERVQPAKGSGVELPWYVGPHRPLAQRQQQWRSEVSDLVLLHCYFRLTIEVGCGYNL